MLSHKYLTPQKATTANIFQKTQKVDIGHLLAQSFFFSQLLFFFHFLLFQYLMQERRAVKVNF